MGSEQSFQQWDNPEAILARVKEADSEAKVRVLTFIDSFYRKKMDQIPKSDCWHVDFHNKIKLGLEKKNVELAKSYDRVQEMFKDDKPPTVAARCWTQELELSFYGVCKATLLSDKEDDCEAMAPFMRALNRNLQGIPNQNTTMTTYRGTPSPDFLECYKVDKVYRLPPFTATSKSMTTAKKFGEYITEFIIPQGCPNAGYLEEITFEKGEEEVLLPAYTAIKVIKVAKTESVALKVQVLDNLEVSESISLATLVETTSSGAESLVLCKPPNVHIMIDGQMAIPPFATKFCNE